MYSDIKDAKYALYDSIVSIILSKEVSGKQGFDINLGLNRLICVKGWKRAAKAGIPDILTHMSTYDTRYDKPSEKVTRIRMISETRGLMCSTDDIILCFKTEHDMFKFIDTYDVNINKEGIAKIRQRLEGTDSMAKLVDKYRRKR